MFISKTGSYVEMGDDFMCDVNVHCEITRLAQKDHILHVNGEIVTLIEVSPTLST